MEDLKCNKCIHDTVCKYVDNGACFEDDFECYEFDAKVERLKGEWKEEHELSCGRILKLRINVVEHKCNNCNRWSIKWAGTIPENFCPNCGAKMINAKEINDEMR